MKQVQKTVFISGMILGFTAGAQAYQGEVEVGYSDGEIESVDIESYDISGAYYFSEVDTSKGPLAEAAFLDRASGLMLSFSDGEIDDLDVDTESQGIALHLVGGSGWYGSLGYTTSELDDGADELEIDVISAGIGKYVAENGLLSLNYSNIELEVDGFGDEDVDTYSIDYKHVTTGDISLSFDVSLVYTDADEDDATGFILGTGIYPSNNFGVGISYSADTVDLGSLGLAGGVALDDIDSDALSFHARWFVSEQFSLAFEYIDGEIEDVDFDAARLSLNLRF
jgi:hypothetical protein